MCAASFAEVPNRPYDSYGTRDGLGATEERRAIGEGGVTIRCFSHTDQNLKYQQNVVGRKIGILVLPTNDWPTIRRKTNEIAAKVATLNPGDFVELVWS